MEKSKSKKIANYVENNLTQVQKLVLAVTIFQQQKMAEEKEKGIKMGSAQSALDVNGRVIKYSSEDAVTLTINGEPVKYKFGIAVRHFFKKDTTTEEEKAQLNKLIMVEKLPKLQQLINGLTAYKEEKMAEEKEKGIEMGSVDSIFDVNGKLVDFRLTRHNYTYFDETCNKEMTVYFESAIDKYCETNEMDEETQKQMESLILLNRPTGYTTIYNAITEFRKTQPIIEAENNIKFGSRKSSFTEDGHIRTFSHASEFVYFDKDYNKFIKTDLYSRVFSFKDGHIIATQEEIGKLADLISKPVNSPTGIVSKPRTRKAAKKLQKGLTL